MKANQRYAIFYFRSRDIFASRGWKSPSSPTVFWLSTPSGGTPSNINVIYESIDDRWKVHLVGYNWICRRQYTSIFIRFAVVASQICEITRNFEKIRTYSSSRSSKVINLGANRKRICNFLLQYCWVKVIGCKKKENGPLKGYRSV